MRRPSRRAPSLSFAVFATALVGTATVVIFGLLDLYSLRALSAYIKSLPAVMLGWTTAFTALIAAVAAAELVGRVRLLAARPFVVLGEWSYAFYLVHQIPIYVALAILGQRGGGWANLAWGALLVVLARNGKAHRHRRA